MTSGHKIQFGVDTISNPALIEGRILNFDSVNRSYRGGYNDTRNPFQLLNLQFDSDKERELFESFPLTALEGYNAVPPYTRSHIVATVGENVFVGQVINYTAYMKLIYSKLNPSYLFNYIVQGNSLLVINNGKEEGVFWNGQVSEMKKISQSKWSGDSPMPIGNISIYAHGRLWILTEDGRLYAGDHLYSQGNNASDEVLLSFKESTYPESGDGFTAPADWGDARGLAVMPRDPSTNGHGEIICFHVNGAYSVNPIDDRNQWTAQNIQQTVMTGDGACSPWSIIPTSSDLYFRKSDKRVASLRQHVAQRTREVQVLPISNEVIKYLEFDSFDTTRFTMSGVDDDRLFFTVNHNEEKDSRGNIHRYANGMVVLDLSSGTNSKPDVISWDGLWTGPRVTGLANLLVGTQRQAIFSSYDKDGKNRLYILSRFRGSDITGSGISKIKSMYSFGNMFDGLSTDSKSNPALASIDSSIVFYSDAIEECTISADYRGSFSQNWFELYSARYIGLKASSDTIFFDVTSDSFATGSPCSVTENTGKRSITGVSFDMRVEIEGTVRIRSNLLVGTQSEMSASYNTSCEGTAYLADDDYHYFSYQF